MKSDLQKVWISNFSGFQIFWVSNGRISDPHCTNQNSDLLHQLNQINCHVTFIIQIVLSLIEASQFDRINMTENWLEYD